MGKKGRWFGKIFGHEEGNQVSCCCLNKKRLKSKRPWQSDPQPSEAVETSELIETEARHDPPPPPLPHAYSVALASAVAGEAAAAVAAKAAAEVVSRTANARRPAKAMEEYAAIKIQTAFRGHQARIALRRLRGVVRLKKMVQGNAVRQQTAETLLSMQTLVRVRSQIRSRRIRMEEENQALLKQLQLKHERELEKLKVEEDWDTRTQSKVEIEARILHRQEASQRREKALAYAFSHQWKTPSRAVPPMFTDPVNPQWGWSWLERWMATRPWENSRTAEMNQFASRAERISPSSRNESPSTPRLRAVWALPIHSDSRSVVSMQSELLHRRRRSIAGSVTEDEESSPSTPTVIPHYLTSTTSTRAKSRFQNYSPSPESANPAKKRLSFPTAEKHTAPSPGSRRHSDSPKVEIFSSEKRMK